MNNKLQAVLELVSTCPLVGYDLYFNFTNQTDNDGNTSLVTANYGTVVKKYTDGEVLKKMQFEIRQVKPFATYSNTNQNVEQMQIVQEFLDWINEQGKTGNLPDFGTECEVQDIRTPEGVYTPILEGNDTEGALYAFPFEVLYLERN